MPSFLKVPIQKERIVWKKKHTIFVGEHMLVFGGAMNKSTLRILDPPMEGFEPVWQG